MTNVMVDSETMGTRPGDVLASLGACVFDLLTGKIGETFYMVIDQGSCERLGMKKDPATVSWWAEQSVAAQEALLVDPQPIGDVLTAFTAWWKKVGGDLIWSQGANFDEPLLAAAYRFCGLTPPWKFWNARDTRTVYDLAKYNPNKRIGVYHNALDDALTQAADIHACYRILFDLDQVDAHDAAAAVEKEMLA